MYKDLREFIGAVDKLGALRRIEGADPRFEIGGITEVAAGLPDCPNTGKNASCSATNAAVNCTDRGLGIPRMARLAVTGKPGSLQIRLVDPAMRNLRIGQNLGLGACTGDSGAPVFDGQTEAGVGQIIGIVSWSTAPGDEEGCGGLTGVTPLLLYRDWIVDTARKFNSPLGP